MGLHGGRYAVVDGFSNARNWTVTETSAPKTYVNSATRAGTGRKKGPKDWSGSFSTHGHTPIVMPASYFTFTGYTAPTSGLRNSVGVTYSGSAIVDQVAISWNFESGDILGIQYSFSGNGALTEGTGTYVDTGAPDVTSVLDGAKIQRVIKGGGAAATLDYVTTCTLTITAANQTAVNSTTLPWTLRKPGPIDWTMALAVQNDSKAALGLEPGEDYEWKLYVDATLYYWLKWGHVQDFSGLNCDVESGAIISCTVNVGMAGGGAALGSIRLPGASTDWWPAAA